VIVTVGEIIVFFLAVAGILLTIQVARTIVLLGAGVAGFGGAGVEGGGAVGLETGADTESHFCPETDEAESTDAGSAEQLSALLATR